MWFYLPGTWGFIFSIFLPLERRRARTASIWRVCLLLLHCGGKQVKHPALKARESDCFWSAWINWIRKSVPVVLRDMSNISWRANTWNICPSSWARAVTAFSGIMYVMKANPLGFLVRLSIGKSTSDNGPVKIGKLLSIINAGESLWELVWKSCFYSPCLANSSLISSSVQVYGRFLMKSRPDSATSSSSSSSLSFLVKFLSISLSFLSLLPLPPEASTRKTSM